MRRHLLRHALEERSNGQAERECEYVFYARLEDVGQLLNAESSEHQEQWEITVPKNAENYNGGRMRVRKTVPMSGGDAEYVLTVKTQIPNSHDELEVPVPTTEAMFEQFRAMSPKGMIKDRYLFPIEGTDLVWEVDMFYVPGAEVGSRKYHDWCKIDLEVPSRNTAIPPMPLKFAESIMAQEGSRTVEEETQVARLYDNYFTLKNTHT